MVGYPKVIPAGMANSGRQFDLTLVIGGAIGPEIDDDLVDAGRSRDDSPYQGQPESRAAVNDGTIAYKDRNASTLGDEVYYRQLVDPEVAVVEVVAVGEGWLILTGSIGHTPAFVEAADRIVVELNDAAPLELQKLHDVTVSTACRGAGRFH